MKRVTLSSALDLKDKVLFLFTTLRQLFPRRKSEEFMSSDDITTVQKGSF